MRVYEETRITVPRDKEGLKYFGELIKKYYQEDIDFHIKDSTKYITIEFTKEMEVKV